MILTAKNLEDAIIYATEKHKGIVRKGDGRPYILHPISVMVRLMGVKSDSKNIYLLAIAAMMHDVVEDCFDNYHEGLTEISTLFGYQVGGIVEELTSDKEQIKLVGKKEYLLNKMLKMSNYSLCIKLCDRLDNLNDMVTMTDDFICKQCDDTTFILNGLTNSRALTKTHKKIIKAILKTISKHKVY